MKMTFTLVAQLGFLLATRCVFAFNVKDNTPLRNDFRDISNDFALEETELMFDKEPSAAEDKNVENPKGAEDRWEEDEEINVVENGIESAVPGNHSSTLGVEPIPNSQPTYPPRPGRKRSPYGGRERNGRDRSSRGEHKLVGYRRPYRLRVRKHARGRRRIRGGRYGRERWRY